MARYRLIAVVLAVAGLAGCATIGPRAIRNARFDYNEAVVRTFDEQMLLNLVRLRYRDTPYFLEVSNISTQYELSGSASAAVEGGDSHSRGLGAGVGYVERPTIVYTPLAGGDFAQRLLTPLSPDSLLLLTGAGWRIDRVLRCSVVRINDAWNAPEASGPTPEYPPVFDEFKQAALLLSDYRKRRAVKLEYDDSEGRRDLVLRFDEDETDTPERKRLESLLGLDARTRQFRVNVGTTERSSAEIAIVPRSLIGVMYFLSQAVEAPERDRLAGRVTVTRNDDGGEFDWSLVLGDLFRVRSSLDTPENAFVNVRYRNAWFYIDDSDLSSKSTFNLVGQLFNLQAGEIRGESPLLTLPLGP